MQTKLQPVPAANPVILSVRNLSLHYFQKTRLRETNPRHRADKRLARPACAEKLSRLSGLPDAANRAWPAASSYSKSPVSAEILYDGRNLLELKSKELKEVRRDIHLIFQDSASALNPGMTIEEVLRRANRNPRAQPRQKRSLPAPGFRVRTSRPQLQMADPPARRTQRRPASTRRHRTFAHFPPQNPRSRRSSQRPRPLHAIPDREPPARSPARAFAHLSLHHPRLRLARMLAHDVVAMKAGRILDSPPSSLLTPDIHAKSASSWLYLNRNGY